MVFDDSDIGLGGEIQWWRQRSGPNYGVFSVLLNLCICMGP